MCLPITFDGNLISHLVAKFLIFGSYGLTTKFTQVSLAQRARHMHTLTRLGRLFLSSAFGDVFRTNFCLQEKKKSGKLESNHSKILEVQLLCTTDSSPLSLYDLPQTSFAIACTPIVLHMHKKFQVNRTKIKGSCQSYTKAAPQES